MFGYDTNGKTPRVERVANALQVVTIVTGGVKSNIARTHRSLPQGSIYLPLKEEYEGRQVHSQAMGMPTEAYARTVVHQVLYNPKKDTVWAGGKSWLVWFVSVFFPRKVLDIAMTRMFKLNKLRQAQQQTKKVT